MILSPVLYSACVDLEEVLGSQMCSIAHKVGVLRIDMGFKSCTTPNACLIKKVAQTLNKLDAAGIIWKNQDKATIFLSYFFSCTTVSRKVVTF